MHARTLPPPSLALTFQATRRVGIAKLRCQVLQQLLFDYLIMVTFIAKMETNTYNDVFSSHR